MTNIRSLMRKLVPLGNWSPDAVEYAPGLLDQVANAVPVFGVYRTIQRLHLESVCPDPKRVTGTYVHRLSVDQSLDIMQPNWAESSPPFGPQRDFQVVPGSLLQPFPGTGNTQGWNQFYKAINGLGANASSYIMFLPHDALSDILFGHFTRPRMFAWDGINSLLVSIQYHIKPGYVGGYEFWVRIGTVGLPIDDEASFVPLVGGELHLTGNLATDATGAPTQVQLTILAADLPANPQLQLYGWQLQHDIEAVGAGKLEFEPVDAASVNPVDRQSLKVSGWKDQDGSNDAADIAAALDLAADVLPATAENVSLVRSRPIYATETGGIGFYFKCDLDQFVNLHDHEIIFNWSVGRLDQEVSLALLKTRDGGFEDVQDVPTGNLIQQWTGISAAAPDTVTQFHIQGPSLTDGVNPELISHIQDWSKVWFFFFAHVPAGPTAADLELNTLRPDVLSPGAYSEFPTWTQFGVSPSHLAAISDSSGLTGLQIVSPGMAASNNDVHAAIFFKLQPFYGPASAIEECQIIVSAASTGSTRIKFTLIDMVTNATYDTGSEGQFMTFTGSNIIGLSLNANGLARITHWDQVRVVVSVFENSTGTFSLAEVRIEFFTGPSSIATLHGVKYIAPAPTEGSNSPIDVSWIRLDGPALVATVEQDDLLLYAGTVDEIGHVPQEGRIYQIAAPTLATWEDVSKAGGYSSNNRDKSWSFTGFGSMVIATNYADPVQVKTESDLLFRDLVGFDAVGVSLEPAYSLATGVYPRARFAATINAFLCLANCDPSSVAGVAQPYTFWCSRFAQPQYFAIGSIEWQSSAFQLLATTGEITGLVGGEWGLIFKENSIWRADYAGLPQVFEFTQVSGMQGTTQSRSIVKIEDDVYFFSTGGIYAVRGGQQLEEIASHGSIRKFLFDSQFEQFAVSTFVANKESEQASKVIGGYDAYTGCIFWSYITKRVSGEDANDDDYLFKCDAILIYNPREGKFGFVAGDGITVFSGDTRIVDISDLFSTNSLEINGFFSLGNRQLSAGTYLHKTILATSGIAPKLMSFSAAPDGTHGGTYEQFFRSGTIPSTYFGAKPGVEVALQQIRPILAVERQMNPPVHTVWIEANQSPAIGDGSGRIVSVSSDDAHPDGWIDLGIPLSGEWFKFATVFEESVEPILKEFHGWQIIYSIKGDH